MKDKKSEKRKPPLASWVDIVQPAILATKTGAQRFAITIKLPERSLKSASSFLKETNEALQAKLAKAANGRSIPQFILLDSERARLQRASAEFSTFKEANACLTTLADLGLQTTKVSAELEDFGNKQFDPWFETVSRAWWPWLAAWRNPPPEMPMAKITNRLDLSEGTKYKESSKGKLGKSDEVDRSDAQSDRHEADETDEDESRRKDKPRRKKE